jgi:hypothetical protein
VTRVVSRKVGDQFFPELFVLIFSDCGRPGCYPYSLVGKYQRFGETYWLYLQVRCEEGEEAIKLIGGFKEK